MVSTLTLLLLPLPLLTLSLPSTLLYPLFNQSLTESINVLYLILLLVASTLFHSVLPLSSFSWRYSWLLLSVLLIASDSVSRLGATTFLDMGAYNGLWTAKLAVQGAIDLTRITAVLSLLNHKSGILVRLPLVAMLVVTYLNSSSFNLGIPYLIPQCYLLQSHGVLLALIALYLPSSYLPTKPIPCKKHKSKPTPSSSPSFTSSHHLLLSLLAVLYLTSLPTSHCPLSPLPRPSFLSSSLPQTSRILASKKSLTGRIVVGEENKNNGKNWIRYLRCDHSFLGGIWIGPSRDEVVEDMKDRGVSLWDKVDEKEVVRRAETIYSTFILQEIIRLARVPPAPQSPPENGLIIGLGAGFSARALHEHRVNLTIVEIDPVVYEFSREYFGVEVPTGEVVLEDAREFLKRNSSMRYDYIIHDVFTGGTVPSLLFTHEFWTSLKAVVSPSGLVAINFAGNLQSKASRLVITTILTSFTSCRAFNDGPLPSSSQHTKFHNLVLICSSSTLPIKFRRPIEKDFLKFPSPIFRRKILERFLDWEIEMKLGDGVEVLTDETVATLDQEQLGGAWEHWEIMKSVLPNRAWALY